MNTSWRPADPDTLADMVADSLDETPAAGAALRVAIDGPSCADPLSFAHTVAESLRRRGHVAPVISADSFWRDASLRLEYGREDALAYRSWLDVGALKREVLDPLGPGGSGCYLPSLRNSLTNRSTREAYRRAVAGTVLLVAGEFLLDDALPFDSAVHLRLSPSARQRRTPDELAWTLAAHVEYDESVSPAERADIVIKLDDPRHPALSLR